ncbi:type IV pilus secretin PilQ family protein [Psychrobacter pygoscelis]|uniref:type IV pilus secretin PilQ family protein n=1 Tax=Psychrobacter pygoscelis TaxID=2488563 RepID=UPI001F6262F8|nr:type IV pilus secretin PilQ family protein [Psychrobacter pygoscelis]
MSAKFMASALTASMIAISSTAYAEQTLNSVAVVQTTPSTTQMRLGFEGTPVIPKAYQLDDPSRLVLDFNDVRDGLSQRFKEYHVGMVNDLTTLSNDSTTRLIVGLKRNGDYTSAVQGNELLLTMTDPQAAPSPVTPVEPVIATPIVTPIEEAPKASSTQANKTAKDTPPETMVVRVNPLLNPSLAASTTGSQYSYDAINALNYAGAGAGGNISIDLTNDALPVDVQRQGNRLVIRITGATIPQRLLRRLAVNGSLVDSIDTKNQGQNGVITINLSGDYDYQAFQSGSQLNISIKEPELLREPTLEEKQYSGEPLSMEFQDVEIRSVLDILAQFTELNIVASDSVNGNITLRLINVPWDQALDIILKSKNLAKRENGNVILVAPAAELAEQEAKELEAQQAVEAFMPLRTEYIRLNYARAQDILNLISQGRGSNSGNSNAQDSGSLLSSRGTVTIDERTNTLIVKDVSESIQNIHELVEKIDIPVRQVMIEARIVSASDNFSKELGVRWGILSNGAANNRNLLVGGSNQTLWDLKDFNVQTTTINGQTVSYPNYDISRPDNLNVDLGVANPAGRIAFGLLSMSDMMLDLELSAMQADNRGEVISTPKVLTADKQTARVSSGTQIPYQEASASGATSTSFREAALSLEATPNITPDGKIGLALNITNGTPTVINGSVAIAEDSINTNVIVEDGQTVVLGGIFKNQISNGVSKVPFLGDLPYIGRAFRNNRQTNDKQELLIFITPKLINDGISRLN